MPGARWLELLCRHIPDRYEHLVRYLGWYSNRARGERAKLSKVQQTANTSTAVLEPESEFAARARAAWARLIRKVYEADPLECPKCKGPMRVIALIDDPHVVRRILEQLGAGRPSPPGGTRLRQRPTGCRKRCCSEWRRPMSRALIGILCAGRPIPSGERDHEPSIRARRAARRDP